MDDGFRLWGGRRFSPPLRPADPESFPESDARHWYDLEYAGWFAGKEPMPESPGDGPAGKRIVCFRPGIHPYMALYDAGMSAEAARFGIELEIRRMDTDGEPGAQDMPDWLSARPDLIILVPDGMEESALLLRQIHSAGIPVIASNLKPDPEGFRYVLAWTGPDDWGQFRSLAAAFAARTKGRGGYCLITHRPGNSAYYARRWAAVTELARIAPDMRLLDARFTGFRADETAAVVKEWLARFGPDLAGIISADDSAPMLGVERALAEAGRRDVVRVACGATGPGMRFIKEGLLDAITYQSPELDGALPVRVAADWFNGLDVEPVRYLPHYIITKDNVDDFLLMPRELSAVDPEELCVAISGCDLEAARRFFSGLRERLHALRVVPEEYFYGSCMEILSRMAQTSRAEAIPSEPFSGRGEMLFRQLTMQKNPEATLVWLETLAFDLIAKHSFRYSDRRSLGERLVHRLETGYAEPLSLKGLSEEFGISAARLGKLFHDTSGESFAQCLNGLRIRKARILLAGGRLSAKEVAARVGYQDPNYFYGMFKKVTGIYPSGYLASLGDRRR